MDWQLDPVGAGLYRSNAEGLYFTNRMEFNRRSLQQKSGSNSAASPGTFIGRRVGGWYAAGRFGDRETEPADC